MLRPRSPGGLVARWPQPSSQSSSERRFYGTLAAWVLSSTELHVSLALRMRPPSLRSAPAVCPCAARWVCMRATGSACLCWCVPRIWRSSRCEQGPWLAANQHPGSACLSAGRGCHGRRGAPLCSASGPCGVEVREVLFGLFRVASQPPLLPPARRYPTASTAGGRHGTAPRASARWPPTQTAPTPQCCTLVSPHGHGWAACPQAPLVHAAPAPIGAALPCSNSLGQRRSMLQACVLGARRSRCQVLCTPISPHLLHVSCPPLALQLHIRACPPMPTTLRRARAMCTP